MCSAGTESRSGGTHRCRAGGRLAQLAGNEWRRGLAPRPRQKKQEIRATAIKWQKMFVLPACVPVCRYGTPG